MVGSEVIPLFGWLSKERDRCKELSVFVGYKYNALEVYTSSGTTRLLGEWILF